MNKIAGVRNGEHGAEENCKYLKVIVPNGADGLTITAEGITLDLPDGKIAVVPPLVTHSVAGGSEKTVTVLIEQPLLPLKGVAVIDDAANGGIRYAAEQAALFSKAENCAKVLNALGELIVSYIAVQSATA